MKEWPDQNDIKRKLEEVQQICDDIHCIGAGEEFENVVHTQYPQGRQGLIDEAIEKNSGLKKGSWKIIITNKLCQILFVRGIDENRIRELLQVIDFYIQMAEIEAQTSSTMERLRTRRLTRPNFEEPA